MTDYRDHILIRLSPEDIAAELGTWRQADADSRGLFAKCANTWMHKSGYHAEQVVAKYLGEPMPGDASLEGDRSRGHDVGGYEVRSVYHLGEDIPFFTRDRDKALTDPLKVYICVVTCEAPVYRLVGWITAYQAFKVATKGRTRKGDEPCWYVDQKCLKPLPRVVVDIAA